MNIRSPSQGRHTNIKNVKLISNPMLLESRNNEGIQNLTHKNSYVQMKKVNNLFMN